jgi:translation initiation factor 3 subunit C
LEALSKDKDAVKKLSKVNAKGFTAMRQTLRKHNADYEAKIAAYRKNPAADDEEESEEPQSAEESGSDSFEPTSMKAKPKSGASKWMTGGSDSDDESDDSGEGDGDSDDAVKSKWYVSKEAGGEKKKDDGAKREKHTGEGNKRKDKTAAASSAKSEKVEWTAQKIQKNLEDIVALRGRRGTESSTQISQLNALLTVANSEPKFGPALPVAISIQLLAANFDMMLNHQSSPPALWLNCLNLTGNILDQVQKHTIKLAGNMVVTIELEFDAEGAIADPSKVIVAGNVEVFFERLDDELTKMFQNLDAQSTDYPNRLEDEEKLIQLGLRVRQYLVAHSDSEMLLRCSQRLLEHIYFRQTAVGSDRAKLVVDLSQAVFAGDDERLKSRAVLCLIFSHAIHDRFNDARDLMLMSHLQDTIHQTQDISTQILFNRTMVQLGLAAFRLGLISEAHACLMDISGKIKELLAQGMASARYQEKTPEQEKLERARLIPAHMHINPDLIEASHLISAMLLEVPNRASGFSYEKKRVISRMYRRRLEYAERLIFAGPPETVNDVVVAAGTALSKGDWRQSLVLLNSLKVWPTLPATSRDLITTKLQEAGLKTYVLTYGHAYESIKLLQLADLFALPVSEVHSQLSRLIVAEELNASVDRLTGTLVMHRVEPSRLQLMALQYAEKVAGFVESNERLLDVRAGTGYKAYDKPRRDGDNNRNTHRGPRMGQRRQRN